MNAWLKNPITYCVVGIAFASLFEFIRSGLPGLFVLGALIGLYAFLAKGERDDGRFRTGDNSYFIGFVYTLSIITLSLMLDADTLLGGAGDSVSSLLKTIGIALGTSVVGMLCRFLLTHDIRVAEDEFDRDVRAVAVAAYQMKGVVDVAAKSVGHLGGAVREAVEAATPLSEVANGLRQAVDDASQAVEAQVRATGTAVDEATNAHAKALQASLRRIASSLDSYTESVHASARRVGETLDESTRQAIGAVAKGVTEPLEGVVRDIAVAATSLKGVVDATAKSAGNLGDAACEAAEELQAPLRRIASSLDSYTESAHASARRVGETLDESTRQVVAKVNQTLASTVDDLASSTAVAVAQAGEVRSTLAAIDGAAFQRDLGGLTEEIVRLRETVTALNEQIPKLAGGFGKRSLWPWRR